MQRIYEITIVIMTPIITTLCEDTAPLSSMLCSKLALPTCAMAGKIVTELAQRC